MFCLRSLQRPIEGAQAGSRAGCTHGSRPILGGHQSLFVWQPTLSVEAHILGSGNLSEMTRLPGIKALLRAENIRAVPDCFRISLPISAEGANCTIVVRGPAASILAAACRARSLEERTALLAPLRAI